MKNMMKYCLVPLLALSISAILFSACTKKFDEYNTDPTTISRLTTADYGKLLARAQYAVYAGYQTSQNLHADLFTQYFSNTSANFGQDRYVMNTAHLQSGLWSFYYVQVIPNLDIIIKGSGEQTPEAAVAQIWRVFAFHRLTDYWGPIPYFSAGNSDVTSYSYDPQDKIYDDMFKKLAEAVQILNTNPNGKVFAAFDGIYKGDIAKWIKFANTLRLRLALRVSDVDPVRAKSEAEAAVTSGVMTVLADDAYLIRSAQASDYNNLNHLNYNEFRMSATMESYLKGFNDPRLPQYFRPAAGTGTYEGIRNGLTAAQISLPQNNFTNNSDKGPKYDILLETTTPQDVMHTAEAYLLRSEGALKGWNMAGTAQALYEQGITLSMNQWGISNPATITTYINGITAPVAPADYFNSPAVASTPVKWAATDELRKEQINTQKWLATYPDGFEGWANQRRADYPKLYPVIRNENTDIPAGEFIKRVIFTAADRTANGDAVKRAETLLPGGDKANVRLWWDKF
jgi:hypothetical protein